LKLTAIITSTGPAARSVTDCNGGADCSGGAECNGGAEAFRLASSEDGMDTFRVLRWRVISPGGPWIVNTAPAPP